MNAAQKSFELQAQVRQNAEVVKNTLNELYSWEKEIKDKERNIQSQPDNNMVEDNLSMPIRSQNKELVSKNVSSAPAIQISNGTSKSESLESPLSEKQDTHNDPLELKHKKANEIKDCGNKYVKLAEYSKAIEAYTQAIQMYGQDAAYYSNRALCYLKLESYDECIEDCESAIEIDRLAVKAYYRRMMANESLGNNMDALKDCTTVLLIEPKNMEAKRSLERINERLRKNVKTEGPNFTPLRTNLVDILPIDKPAYKRSTKPLKRLPVTDVVGPKESKNHDNLTISDEDIDKLFNSNCGQFEEIKATKNKEFITKATTAIDTKENENGKKVKEKQSFESKKITGENLPTVQKKEYSNKIEFEYYNNQTKRPLPAAPNSTAQFYSNWKELTAEHKYHYLKSIPLKNLCKILGAGFDSDTLSDIINIFRDFYLLEKDFINTANTLVEVSKNKQVSILSLLMSNEERKVLTEIINSLKEANSLDAVVAEQIIKNFNLK